MDLYDANVSQDSSVDIVTRTRTGIKGNRLLIPFSVMNYSTFLSIHTYADRYSSPTTTPQLA